MVLSRRQKLTIILLLLYWPGIFILAHIPIPRLVYNAQVSDKSLHFLGYLILASLLWFAINPNKKVNWHKATAWWVLFAVVWYGVLDEWLQYYVGRDPDVMDFFADLGGTLTGLILLTIFSFWPASLAVTGAVIFVLTNSIRANMADLLPITNAVFHLFAYGFFTMLWLRYIHLLLPTKAPKPKWVIAALALPVGFLLTVKLFSVIFGKDFGMQDVIISVAGITAVVITTCLITLFRREHTRRLSS